MIDPIEAQQHVNLPTQKAASLSEVQPTEATGKKSKLEPGEEWLHNLTRIEKGENIIEQYDESGKLLKITPPGYLPFGGVV